MKEEQIIELLYAKDQADLDMKDEFSNENNNLSNDDFGGAF